MLTASGQHELEASVMTDDGRCGAVALVKHIANPVKLAQQAKKKRSGPGHWMHDGWHSRQSFCCEADNHGQQAAAPIVLAAC